MQKQLIRYESGQSGRYVFGECEFLWNQSPGEIRVVPRTVPAQEAIEDPDFWRSMVENLLRDLDLDPSEIEY